MGKIQKAMTGVLGTFILIVFMVATLAVLTRAPAGDKFSGTGNTSYTLENVSQHDNRTDCWLVVDNRVYNVTGFISRHPGGPGTITARCGKDVTSIWMRIHSNRAWDILSNYKIGNLVNKQENTTQRPKGKS